MKRKTVQPLWLVSSAYKYNHTTKIFHFSVYNSIFGKSSLPLRWILPEERSNDHLCWFANGWQNECSTGARHEREAFTLLPVPQNVGPAVQSEHHVRDLDQIKSVPNWWRIHDSCPWLILTWIKWPANIRSVLLVIARPTQDRFLSTKSGVRRWGVGIREFRWKKLAQYLVQSQVLGISPSLTRVVFGNGISKMSIVREMISLVSCR